MRARNRTWAILPVLALTMMVAIPARSADRLDRVAWLAGCWGGQDSTRTMEETWLAPRGGMMLGVGRTLYKKSRPTFEFMRIRVIDGKLVYGALIEEQGEVSFTETELTDSTVVFANMEHDFPSSIRYRRMPDGSMTARIEGRRGERIRAIDYPMDRVDCEPRAKR